MVFDNKYDMIKIIDNFIILSFAFILKDDLNNLHWYYIHYIQDWVLQINQTDEFFFKYIYPAIKNVLNLWEYSAVIYIYI